MLGKLAVQTTTSPETKGFTFEAGKAVDGIYETDYSLTSVAVSTHVDNPWWRVDLGEEHCVWAVNILNVAGKKTNITV